MKTILEARDVQWQIPEGGGEILNSISILGAVSGLSVLPEISGDEQGTRRFDDTVNNNAGRTNRRGHILPSGQTSNNVSRHNPITIVPQPQKIGISGGRVVLTTRAVDSVSGSTTGLGILEHGFGLAETAKGSIGLPEGSTLFAQRVALGGTDRSLTGGNGCPPGRPGGNKETSCCSTTHEGHLLFLSDRARSTTSILSVSSDGEVGPAETGANKGFDGNRHTVHLGRTEPGQCIVQVTEEAVNIVQQAAPGVFELAASWRPPLLPSQSTSSFKVQHAGTAGTIVAVVCESTMFLIEVRGVAANQATSGRLDDEKLKPSAAAQAEVVLRAKLDGGPASALGMRLHGSIGEGVESTLPAPVLIAIASWDSALVEVLSFPALPTANTANPGDRKRGSEPPESSSPAAAEKIATWLPPWGESVAAAKTPEERRGGGSASLTRALAFVRFGTGSKGPSLVAATGDGAVAVAEWQGGEGEGEWRAGPKTGDDSFSVCTLVTTASFQVGRGSVRLEVFQSPDLVVGVSSGVERNSGDGERLFVNGDIMDAVVRRCLETAETMASDQGRCRWQCTQVCRTGRQSRQSVVFLPWSKESKGSSGKICPQFSWLTTEHPNVAPGGCSGSDGKVVTSTETCNFTRFNGQTLAGPSLSFGSLDDSEPRGRCSHKPLPWTPTHVVYVPTSRSIVVACHTNMDKIIPNSQPGETAANTGATCAPRCGTDRAGSPPTASRIFSTSSLRIFDADTLEERPGTSPLHLLPGVRVTGVALLPGLGGPFGAVAPNDPARPNSRSVPDTAAAVGGDVVAVACGSCTSTTETEEGLGRSAHPAPGVTTVVAAFEVVAYGADGGAVSEDGELPIDATDGLDSGGRQGGGGTGLAPLAASPEMAGACFGLETLGKRFVAGSIDDRIVVLGWEGSEHQGIRPDEPTPQLTLTVQASCRTAARACITALATWGTFVAVAELLHGVSLYRYNECSRVLSLVATHSRERLVVTALALSPRPVAASVGACEQEHSERSAPLIALADRTTSTVAVLSVCRFNPPSSITHIPTVGTTDGIDGRESGGSGEEATSGAVKNLRLVSIWPCREKITSLVAASGMASLVGSNDDEYERNYPGEDQAQQQHQTRQQQQRDPHRHVVNEASRFAGASGNMFLMGSTSGAVWTVGAEPPNS